MWRAYAGRGYIDIHTLVYDEHNRASQPRLFVSRPFWGHCAGSQSLRKSSTPSRAEGHKTGSLMVPITVRLVFYAKIRIERKETWAP